MIRFAWLQSRTQTLVVAGSLAVLAVVAAFTGVHMSHLYANLVAHCEARSNCGIAIGDFLAHESFLQNALDLLLRLFPALIGAFWGAPLLSRELETGTHRLAWTQSVSRRRWVLTRLGILGLATVVLTGALTLTVTWWFRSIDATQDSSYAFFDRRDVVVIGYSLFAFAVGALAGAVVRRTVPAMAATIAVFAAARVAIAVWVRPHLLTPLHTATSLLNANQFGFETSNGAAPALVARGAAPHGAWTIASQLVTSFGHTATLAERTAFVKQYCAQVATPPPFHGSGTQRAPVDDAAAFDACRQHAAQVYHLFVSYQPAGRYWTFQWLELGIFLALALAAGSACYFWVTRRLV
jgi:ABC-type transport system involved in multi-copper enzyme maturation permease subunit